MCEIGDLVWDGLAEEWAAHVRRETALLSEVCSRLYLCEMNLDLRGGILWQKGKEEGQRKYLKIHDLLRVESKVRVKILG